MNRITIEKKGYKVIYTFKTYWHEWECDGYGYVVKRKGKHSIVLTSHGDPYLATKEELEQFIETYEQAITDTKEAIALLK